MNTEIEGLIELRRRLHRQPELRFDEHGTSEIIGARIEGLVDRIRRGVAQTGIVAVIDSGVPGPSILLRADMDAYPVQEESSLEFASTAPGVSHACGHDVHMAVMVGVLERVARSRPTRGRVTWMFQPAEERPFGQPSGARHMLDSGEFEESYDAVLGLHCWPQLPAGTIGVDRRIAMAAKDAFRFDVTGQSAHAATPSQGRDAVLAGSTLVTSLHSAVSRRRDPHEGIAFNVGTFAGGSSQSLVAPDATLTGTLRTHELEVRDRMKSVIDDVSRGVATQYGLGVELTWADEMPAVVNDPTLVAMALDTDAFVTSIISEPPMTSDDFALLTVLGPSLYIKLGVAAPGDPNPSSLHSSSFTVDENCIETGVVAIEWMVRTLLARQEGTPA